MDARTLIASLLPEQGWYVLSALDARSDKFTNLFFDDLDDLLSVAKARNDSGCEVYMTPFTFREKGRRQANNAHLVKSFFLDLDVGDSPKKYPTKKAAAKALYKFLQDTDLPTPTVVDSGGGVHAYWGLESPLTSQQWFPLAVRLKKLCRKFGLLIDPAVTADAARVLRVVGSYNHKREAPCVVVGESPCCDLSEIEAVLDAHIEEESWLSSAKKEWMKSSNLAKHESDPNVSFNFGKIIRMAVEHGQCPQLLYAATNPENTAEPLWRAALSIAWHCDDNDTAIHKLSEGHQGYDPDRTIAKAMATQGKPYRCESFDNISPGLCESCPNYNKLNSPISLGKQLKRSAPLKPVAQASGTNTFVAQQSLQIPVPQNLPHPFFRPAMGGVAVDTVDKKNVPKQVVLTASDIWVDNLVQDERKDYRLAVCINHPQDGFSSCSVTFAEMSSRDTAIKFLATKGITIDPSYKDLFMQYIHKIIKGIQTNKPSLMARDNFGWTPQGSFVLGALEHVPVAKGRFVKAAASTFTEALQPLYMPCGDYSAWRKAMRIYEKPTTELSPMRYGAIYNQFASPLIYFTPQTALMDSMVGPSGAGKSTNQLIGMSVFCSRAAVAKGNSTLKSLFNRMGVLNNLPLVIDELTEETNHKKAQLTLNFTMGHGPDRLEGSSNVERLNTIKWNMIGSVSTNISLHNLFPDKPQNLMRIFEFSCPLSRALDIREVDDTQDIVETNYGWAGFIYVQWLVNHFDAVKEAVMDLKYFVETTFKMRQEERFWTAGIICHLYGAAIAKALGIFDAPIASDITWLKATLVGMRDNVDEMTQNVNDPLTQFVQSNFRNILRIGRDSAGKEIILDIDRVASPIRGRFDTETGTLWIPKRDFKAFAKENSLAADSLDKFAVEDIELLNGLLKNMASKKVACYRIEKHDSYIGNGLSVGGSGSDEPPTSVVAD